MMEKLVAEEDEKGKVAGRLGHKQKLQASVGRTELVVGQRRSKAQGESSARWWSCSAVKLGAKQGLKAKQ